MNKGIELEYKVLVSEEQFQTLLQAYPPQEHRVQINHYYDYPDFSVMKSRQVLRIREFTDSFEFTLKMLDENNTLFEFNKQLPSNSMDDPEIRSFLESHGIDYSNLKELAYLKTERSIYNDGYGELCFDINTYGNKKDYEIEYEMIRETPDFMERFQNIIKKADIQYQPSLPKVIRCLREYYPESDN